MNVMLLQMALVSIPLRQQASTGRGQRGMMVTSQSSVDVSSEQSPLHMIFILL